MERLKADAIHLANWKDTASALAARFGELASDYDRSGEFVFANYEALREARFFSIGVPAELGGGGASHEEVCDSTRLLAQGCGSTALAFAMHSHPVGLNVFKYKRGDSKAEQTLRRIAEKELVIAGTGANDWLESSGHAEKVEGGYRVTATKHFVSGAPGANVLVTSSVTESDQGPEIIHFSVPFNSDGIRIENNWDTLGMRATGSNDVILDNVFVPDAAVVARRPRGVWHPVWDAILPIAMPIIVAAYTGLAEQAYGLIVHQAQKAKDQESLVGEATNALTSAQIALKDMIRLCNNYQFQPDKGLTNSILVRKTLATKAVQQVIELGASMIGGPGFFKGHAMERLIRDSRAMHFHPLPERRQVAFTGQYVTEHASLYS
ncbi:acyl-CoA/acyl-ACP dehydrogenase [Marinobacter sp. 71-i]|uniref:Acyl-CoA/acyl-ACP dehydrogenase n=1 Tax=Marinobacter iranensis TaxID=2962607 RepID=A0ABT5Y518_9GAMM|nr:acyl-CoA dehydrogenase family protein [Marinobacter iranensis]MDF0748639.1 acyl-CoA/acyl-ACP dehydrogenase [Marinobacter iranensis]